MIRKLSLILVKYRELKIKLNRMTTTKEVIMATFGSIVMNLFIFLIPILVVYNLFIFDGLIAFLKVVIFILIAAFVYSYNYFFIAISKTYNDNIEKMDFKIMVIIDSIFAFLIFALFTIAIMSVF